MAHTLGWLHISDIHFLDKTGWRDGRVLETLLADIRKQRDAGRVIDFVLCSGDIGFGQTSKQSLAKQYDDAADFFGEVLQRCDLPIERLFLVPGNHDIDRAAVLESQTEYLRSAKRSPAQINQYCHDQHREWKNWLARLAQYQKFVTDTYKHISLDANATFSADLALKRGANQYLRVEFGLELRRR